MSGRCLVNWINNKLKLSECDGWIWWNLQNSYDSEQISLKTSTYFPPKYAKIRAHRQKFRKYQVSEILNLRMQCKWKIKMGLEADWTIKLNVVGKYVIYLIFIFHLHIDSQIEIFLISEPWKISCHILFYLSSMFLIDGIWIIQNNKYSVIDSLNYTTKYLAVNMTK